VTWRSLLALGVSGGLIPCPAALVVMLSAIALQRVGFGMVLIVVFSLGLAGVLTGIGILWVKARELLNIMSRNNNLTSRIPGGAGRLVQALPVISALFITLVGLGLTLQALVQTGVFGS
jgi:ABC-type nickel/cobalt efflux system permease component RcnA